ncbi:transcription termination factor Rho [Streptomyces sp. SID4919]|uniref:transcription termination factor Rho n=1 Tax=unclassified Streptomyces TaxID=2593676 RepID=UPI000823D35A|nr:MULTISPECIES: transcription termination factor Rho [unclassified Streptomyces]MYY09248.1 transcription termination factor Rho [Streptomyces sp. SID4919]SCK42124.1 transcription termination factor Rho [Streptomyces sp. AmelKG-E11A]
MTSILEHPTTRGTTVRPAEVTVAGVLDLTPQGHGFLRPPDLMPTPQDPYVPVTLVRRLGLRTGDAVSGTLSTGADAKRGVKRTVGRVDLVEGLPPEQLGLRPHFGDLTPLHPREALRMEGGASGLTMRVTDLVSPVGKGQRGLIVAPPKTGKTVLLQQLAAAVARNHPDCVLMVVLLDERPEEVTDMRRTVRGEVLASTFDRPAKDHIALAELSVERAKRLVERGKDVVMLLDSLTRLCRAHNNAASSGGRTLSGGVDARALSGSKRLFGAARCAEEGGSLTILATALVETGSRADDYYFEELKGTGNMEIRLSRELADKRVYPAVDIVASGTRREEFLVPAPDLAVVRGLRRALIGQSVQTALETLLDRMRSTPSNADFLRKARATLPPS